MKKVSTVSQEGEQKNLTTEVNRGAGSGRSLQLVLRARRSGWRAVGTEGGYDGEGAAGGVRGHAARLL